MAIVRLKIDGYGQLELNQAPFRRSGRIEAQCAIADGIEYVENGMLLAVDNVNRVVKYVDSNNTLPIALNYSSEHGYDPAKSGLKNFKLDRGSFLPRLGYLLAGDKYTTNCIAYDETTYATVEAFKEAVGNVKNAPLYAHACNNGAHLINGTATDAIALVLGASSMPDGQFAVKFQAL